MALLKASLFLLELFASYAFAAQIPLNQPSTAFTSLFGDEAWDLNTLPNPNATDHLIFSTVSSLLQHWPNTRYRNGHTVVPGSVAPGTLLYHGRGDNNLPATPEWTATDPEHSYNFCQGSKDTGCWHLTLVTSRELNVVYFDGSSAAKMPNGSMDTQDIVAWGEVIPEKSFSEMERINDLCKWGRKFSIDGFVRMEMDFEIMLCDFTPAGGVEVVSLLNLATIRQRSGGPPRPPGGPRPPDRDGPGESSRDDMHESRPHYGRPLPPVHPSELSSSFEIEPPPGSLGQNSPPSTPVPSPVAEVIYAGQWHAHFPGDTRVTLDLTRLISFYDTTLVPSLVDVRYGKERWDHRVEGISSEDVRGVMGKLEKVVRQGKQRGSGVDWQTLFHVVVDRYADRLEILDYLLNKTSPSNDSQLEQAANVTRTLEAVYAQLKHMLTPYILHGVMPTNLSGSDNSTLEWAKPIYKLCASAHTSYLVKRSTYSSMTESERLLLGSVQRVEKEICRTITRMWSEGVELGFDDSSPVFSIVTSPSTPASLPSSEPENDTTDMNMVAKRWRNEIRQLMSWLDWSVWVKCRPSCSFEEICYLPTWPFFRRRPGPRPSGGPLEALFRDSPGSEDNENEEWERPQPRCIKRFST